MAIFSMDIERIKCNTYLSEQLTHTWINVFTLFVWFLKKAMSRLKPAATNNIQWQLLRRNDWNQYVTSIVHFTSQMTMIRNFYFMLYKHLLTCKFSWKWATQICSVTKNSHSQVDTSICWCRMCWSLFSSGGGWRRTSGRSSGVLELCWTQEHKSKLSHTARTHRIAVATCHTQQGLTGQLWQHVTLSKDSQDSCGNMSHSARTHRTVVATCHTQQGLT